LDGSGLGINLAGLRKSTITLNKDSLCPDRKLNPRSPDYKSIAWHLSEVTHILVMKLNVGKLAIMLFIREGRESILGPEIRYPKVYLGLPPG
jgi:hypothetical protein